VINQIIVGSLDKNIGAISTGQSANIRYCLEIQIDEQNPKQTILLINGPAQRDNPAMLTAITFSTRDDERQGWPRAATVF
jgi:hypothetical protein